MATFAGHPTSRKSGPFDANSGAEGLLLGFGVTLLTRRLKPVDPVACFALKGTALDKPQGSLENSRATNRTCISTGSWLRADIVSAADHGLNVYHDFAIRTREHIV